MVQRRQQTGAWFQLLRSYLSQCNTVHREDHHPKVEGDEVKSRILKVLRPHIRVFSCSKASGGRIQLDPAKKGGGIAYNRR